MISWSALPSLKTIKRLIQSPQARMLMGSGTEIYLQADIVLLDVCNVMKPRKSLDTIKHQLFSVSFVATARRFSLYCLIAKKVLNVKH